MLCICRATNFQRDHYELWVENDDFCTTVLTPHNELKKEQEFHLRTFEYLNAKVQDQIFELAVHDFDDSFYNCQRLLGLLKRFPIALRKHAVN